MSFPVKNFLTAIYNKFDADATLKASVTGLYLAEAPQGTDYPYITYHLINDTADRTFGTSGTPDEKEDIRLQFSIWDNSSSGETALDIFDYLTSCFDDTTLSVTGYDCVYMTRAFMYILREEGASKEERVWHIIVDYYIRLDKS